MKHRLLSLPLALLLLLCAAPLAPCGALGPQASAALEQARAYGLLSGETAAAGLEMSRGEFAGALCRLCGWAEQFPPSPSYPDCPAERPYYGAVEALRARGVLDEGGLFRPDSPISREELAVMLVRALGYDTLAQSLDGVSLPFSDAGRSRGCIALVWDTGLVTGIEQNGALCFKPGFSVKREEAAAILVRAYERLYSRLDWLHGFYAFSSYGQIDLTADMDGVSVGWARMEYDPALGPVLNSTSANGNDWIKPADPAPATDFFQAHQIPYNLCVYASAADTVALPGGGETSTVSALVSVPEARAAAVSALVSAVPDYAGITIDFEALKGDELKAQFPLFLSELRAALPADKTLYVCVQPGTWYTGYDYRAIGEACDRVILMAHDYQWPSVPDGYVGGTNTDSPVTPFPSIYRALREITDPDAGVQDRSKLALAVSFGSAGFRVDEAGTLLSSAIYHPAPSTIAQRLTQPGTVITYDPVFRNPAALYALEDGDLCRLWYEDARSVSDKLALARMFGVTGVSLWRIGNIPTAPGGSCYYDVWSTLLVQRQSRGPDGPIGR